VSAQQLSRCHAFAALDAGVREELAAAAVWQTGRRGQTLVAENADWPFIGMVTEGIVARANGGGRERERILYEIFPYELFGVAEYFDRGFKMARIAVFSKSARVLKVPWEVVSRVAARYPELTNALGIVMAQRIRILADALNVQGSLPILGRIARVLLPYAMPERGLVPAAASLSTITQSQIAAAGGTVKEVAARAIAELESRSALRREHGHIRYLDREVLLELIQDVS
jgi:CRP-like cAMP-binding protein